MGSKSSRGNAGKNRMEYSRRMRRIKFINMVGDFFLFIGIVSVFGVTLIWLGKNDSKVFHPVPSLGGRQYGSGPRDLVPQRLFIDDETVGRIIDEQKEGRRNG